jgi:UDP-N-acetyl-D-mannosaminuronic acid dehydrogenase
LCTDPYVGDADFVPLEEAVRRADIVIVGAPHSVYQSLKIPHGRQIVDVWGIWPEQRALEAFAATAGHHTS